MGHDHEGYFERKRSQMRAKQDAADERDQNIRRARRETGEHLDRARRSFGDMLFGRRRTSDGDD
ncbi:hypothetical protein [Streptomyces hydrogenans]|uniref:hypothetical protein n=1 Tax=Streptomyces hydrogenans TaxID=1873719 RepID=UPI00331C5464